MFVQCLVLCVCILMADLLPFGLPALDSGNFDNFLSGGGGHGNVNHPPATPFTRHQFPSGLTIEQIDNNRPSDESDAAINDVFNQLTNSQLASSAASAAPSARFNPALAALNQFQSNNGNAFDLSLPLSPGPALASLTSQNSQFVGRGNQLNMAPPPLTHAQSITNITNPGNNFTLNLSAFTHPNATSTNILPLVSMPSTGSASLAASLAALTSSAAMTAASAASSASSSSSSAFQLVNNSSGPAPALASQVALINSMSAATGPGQPAQSSSSASSSSSSSSSSGSKKRRRKASDESAEKKQAERKMKHREIDAKRRKREAAALSELQTLTFPTPMEAAAAASSAAAANNSAPDRVSVLSRAADMIRTLQTQVSGLNTKLEQKKKAIAEKQASLVAGGEKGLTTKNSSTALTTRDAQQQIATLQQALQTLLANWQKERQKYEWYALRSSFFMDSSVVLVVADMLGKTIDVNKAYMLRTGWRREEIIGKFPCSLSAHVTNPLLASLLPTVASLSPTLQLGGPASASSASSSSSSSNNSSSPAAALIHALSSSVNISPQSLLSSMVELNEADIPTVRGVDKRIIASAYKHWVPPSATLHNLVRLYSGEEKSVDIEFLSVWPSGMLVEVQARVWLVFDANDRGKPIAHVACSLTNEPRFIGHAAEWLEHAQTSRNNHPAEGQL